jgi:hypothetical protein
VIPRLSLLIGSATGGLLPDEAGPTEVGAGVTAFVVPVGYFVLAGERAFLRSFSSGMLVLGLTFAISYVNHVVAWGFRRGPRPDANPADLLCLDRLLWLQGGVALVWLAAGVLLVIHPCATVPLVPLGVPWITVFTWTIIPGVVVTVVASGEKAKAIGLKFVTESVRSSRPAKSLRRIAKPLERVVMLKPLRRWLEGKEIGVLSGFSIFLISTLLLFGGEGLYGVAVARVSAGVHHLLTHETGSTQPTYEELCPGGGVPGSPAPRPSSDALYGLWLGESGAGAIEGGCAQPAHVAKDHPAVWVEEGLCEGSLRSYGIAADRPASLLYQQAARFALAKEREGVLLGASSREDLRDGDFYLVETELGPYVLIRPQKATGVAPADSTPRRCEDYTSDNYPYTTVPPGLVRIWLQISQHELVFPVSVGRSHGAAQKFTFLGADSGTVVGEAECADADTCSATVPGRGTLGATDASSISLEAILAVVRGY